MHYQLNLKGHVLRSASIDIANLSEMFFSALDGEQHSKQVRIAAVRGRAASCHRYSLSGLPRPSQFSELLL